MMKKLIAKIRWGILLHLLHDEYRKNPKGFYVESKLENGIKLCITVDFEDNLL